MSRKRLSRTGVNETIAQLFPRFLTAKSAQGVSAKTLTTYRTHFQCIGKHIDLSIPIRELARSDIDSLIVSMRYSGLAHNSISSYVRVFRTFLHWCNEEGYTTLEFPNMRDKETVKEVYTDEELARLLEKPERDSDFAEYRNWVIINFLMNCGCRASTVRNIRISDVSLSDRQIIFRHTKTGKIQSIPLCSSMVSILKEYMTVRGGTAQDYLFPNQFGEMLTESAFASAIRRYNTQRGVKKTSLHLFRHTFARKYLIDCGGDAFMLQRLLGHSTLDMTKHYCAIYDSDIAGNYDAHSPLSQLNRTTKRIIRR